MSLNKIEKDLIKSLNNLNESSCNWRVLKSNKTIKSDLTLNEREQRIYDFIVENFESNNVTDLHTIKQFNSMFIDWSKETLTEKVSAIPTNKEIEKACKKYFLDNKPNDVFYLILNSDNVLFLYRGDFSLGIYEVKQVETSDELNDETSDNETSDELNDVQKISVLINDIVSLANSMSNKEKIEIVKQLEKALNVNATVNIIKKENIA